MGIPRPAFGKGGGRGRDATHSHPDTSFRISPRKEIQEKKIPPFVFCAGGTRSGNRAGRPDLLLRLVNASILAPSQSPPATGVVMSSRFLCTTTQPPAPTPADHGCFV